MESRKKKIVFNIILSVVCVMGGGALLNYVIGLVFGDGYVWLTLMIVGFAVAFDLVPLDKNEREQEERKIKETGSEGH